MRMGNYGTVYLKATDVSILIATSMIRFTRDIDNIYYQIPLSGRGYQ